MTGQAGMTLVEMLVVLTIIAITASLAVLSLNAGGPARGQAEARRLEARLQLAADEAMLSDHAVALDLGPATSSAATYTFVEWNEAQRAWRPSQSAQLAERYSLPRGMTLVSSDGRRLLPLGNDDAAGEVAVVLASGSQQWTVAFDGLTVSTAHVSKAT